jgi:hypothetical protein
MAFHPSTGGIGALGALSKASVNGVGEPMSTDALIANLVGMTPAERQQFASDNANDPMKLSAAKYVDNQLKVQASQLAAQQNRTAPPPVNQQAVASMAGTPAPAPQQMAQGLPEDTGIGALPVPAMKHMAAGGIVAFSGKDDSFVRGYMGTTPGIEYSPAYGYPGAPNQGLLPDRSGYEGMDFGDMMSAMGSDASNYMGNLVGKERWNEFTRSRNKDKPKEYGQGREGSRKPDVTVPNVVQPTRPGADAAATKMEVNGPVTTSAADAIASVNAPTGAPRPTATGATPVQQPGETSDAMWKRIYGAMPDARANLPKEIQEAEDIKTEQANKVLTSEKQAATGLAALLGKRDSRLLEREKRLADKSSNDINMSLIDAGLAMMQSRGQGLAGIAEGAGVGMKRYTEESRLTEAARQKIEEARDAYDDLKFNREDMSRKQILAAEGTIADARVASKTANVAEIARREGINLKTAEHIYDADAAKQLQAQNQQFQKGENALNRANALQAAGITSSGGLNNQLGLLTALGKSNPEDPIAKGFRLQKLEAQEPMLFKAYTDLVSDPIKGDKIRAQYPDFSAYMADFNKHNGIVALPGGATTPTAPVVLPR